MSLFFCWLMALLGLSEPTTTGASPISQPQRPTTHYNNAI